MNNLTQASETKFSLLNGLEVIIAAKSPFTLDRSAAVNNLCYYCQRDKDVTNNCNYTPLGL